jgi:hypothetical protein
MYFGHVGLQEAEARRILWAALRSYLSASQTPNEFARELQENFFQAKYSPAFERTFICPLISEPDFT